MRPRPGLYFDGATRWRDEPCALPRARSETPWDATFAFYWSHRRLRRLGRLVAALALLTAPLMLSQQSVVRALCLGWFVVLAVCANGLARRMACREPVLVIDRVGLRDHRAFDRLVSWQDVRALHRCHPTRCRVLELFLRHPQRSTADQKAWTRFGGRLQRAFGVPALSINLLLLDADATEVLAAIATFRPGLIPPSLVLPSLVPPGLVPPSILS